MLERMSNLRRAQGAAIGAILTIASCASTTLTTTWVDPSYGAGPVKKVFVMALSARDVTRRRVFEDIMVGKLHSAGVQAVPAYQVSQGAEMADEPTLQAAVEQSGSDTLMMSRLLSINTQVTGVSDGYGWYGAYSGWYGYPEVTTTARVETSLYNVATKKVVWTAVSETVNPGSVQDEAPGLADAVIKDLRSKGLIASM
jgi:hypothetical protein